MKTVLITGCSSGFGLDTAKYFLENGWKVIATMRKPNEARFPKSPNLRVLALDVTNADSIKAAIAEAGPIDVLVNNAGVGMLNIVETVSIDEVRSLYETNVFGPIAMMKAVVPQMRERKSGVIVNVTSSVTSRPLPLLSVYTSTKHALNAFTEVVQLELAPFNIQVRNVLPGRGPTTKFGENARLNMAGFTAPYQPLVQQVMAAFQTPTDHVTHPADVAKAVFKAASEPALVPMKFPAGVDAVAEEKKRMDERR